MHSKLLESTVNRTNIKKRFVPILLEAVKKPDLEEFFLYGQKHFYYPNDRVKSYLDYKGTHNAKYMYNEHLKNMRTYFVSGNMEKAYDEAGRALHYLQDMTQPNHIDSGSIIKKIIEARMPHHKFEMDMYNQQNKLCENSSLVDIKSEDFDSLFDEIIKKSTQNEVPRRSNIDHWNTIGQDAVNLCLSATQRFIEILTKN